MVNIAKSLKTLFALFKPMQLKEDKTSIGIARAQHALVSRNLNSIATLSTILATALVISLVSQQSPTLPLLWYALTLPLPIGQFITTHRLRKRQKTTPSKNKPFSWNLLRTTERSILYSAIIWALVAILFSRTSQEALYFTTLLQVSMCTGLGMMISPLPRIVMRFTIVSLIPLAFVLMLEATTFSITLAILIFVLIGAIYAGSMTSYHQLRRIVGSEAKTQKAESIMRTTIEAMPDAVALYDADGEILLTNENHQIWNIACTAPQTKEGEITHTPSEQQWFRHKWLDVPGVGTLSLHSDISVQKERENALIAAKHAAEVANGTRARFLSRMSHELRTPLNSILGFSSVLAEGRPQPVALVKEYADFIQESGQQLLTMIEDVIEYSNAGKDMVQDNTGPVDLKTAINTAIEKARKKPGCQEEKSYKIRIQEGTERFIGNAPLIDRILTALISNAIKFSPQAPDIAITSRLTPDNHLSIIIRDFGKGMSKSEIADAFAIFYQADDSRNRAQEGAGLGLALVRKLTDRANIKIKVMSEVGRGTAIVLIFGAAAIPAASDMDQQIKA